jgi:hypothetical protein
MREITVLIAELNSMNLNNNTSLEPLAKLSTGSGVS